MPNSIQLITEDFVNLDSWDTYGYPRPTTAIVDGVTGLKVNGDSSYHSGVYSRYRLPSNAKITFEFDLFIDDRDYASPWEVVVFGLVQSDTLPNDSSYGSFISAVEFWGRVPSGTYARDYSRMVGGSIGEYIYHIPRYGWMNIRMEYDWNNGSPKLKYWHDGSFVAETSLTRESVGDSFRIGFDGRSYYNCDLVKNLSVTIGTSSESKITGSPASTTSYMPEWDNITAGTLLSRILFYGKHLLSVDASDKPERVEASSSFDLGSGVATDRNIAFVVSNKGILAYGAPEEDQWLKDNGFIPLHNYDGWFDLAPYIHKDTCGLGTQLIYLGSGGLGSSSLDVAKRLVTAATWPGFYTHMPHYAPIERSMIIGDFNLSEIGLNIEGSKMCWGGDRISLKIEIFDRAMENKLFTLNYSPTGYSGNTVTMTAYNDNGEPVVRTVSGTQPANGYNGWINWIVGFVEKDGELLFVADARIQYGMPATVQSFGPVGNFTKLMSWENKTKLYVYAYGTYSSCSAHASMSLVGRSTRIHGASAVNMPLPKLVHYRFKEKQNNIIKGTGSDYMGYTNLRSFDRAIDGRTVQFNGLIGNGTDHPYTTGLSDYHFNTGVVIVFDYFAGLDTATEPFQHYQYICGTGRSTYNSNEYGVSIVARNGSRIAVLTPDGNIDLPAPHAKAYAMPGTRNGWVRCAVSIKEGEHICIASNGVVKKSSFKTTSAVRSTGNQIGLCSFTGFSTDYARSAVVGEFAVFGGYVSDRELLKYTEAL